MKTLALTNNRAKTTVKQTLQTKEKKSLNLVELLDCGKVKFTKLQIVGICNHFHHEVFA